MSAAVLTMMTMMLLFASLSLLLLRSTAVMARDFSLYGLPFFEDFHDDLAVIKAGLNVQHVHENHPAVIANLRDAMHGGTPVVFTTETTPFVTGLPPNAILPPLAQQQTLPQQSQAAPHVGGIANQATAMLQEAPPKQQTPALQQAPPMMQQGPPMQPQQGVLEAQQVSRVLLSGAPGGIRGPVAPQIVGAVVQRPPPQQQGVVPPQSGNGVIQQRPLPQQGVAPAEGGVAVGSLLQPPHPLAQQDRVVSPQQQQDAPLQKQASLLQQSANGAQHQSVSGDQPRPLPLQQVCDWHPLCVVVSVVDGPHPTNHFLQQGASFRQAGIAMGIAPPMQQEVCNLSGTECCCEGCCSPQLTYSIYQQRVPQQQHVPGAALSVTGPQQAALVTNIAQQQTPRVTEAVPNAAQLQALPAPMTPHKATQFDFIVAGFPKCGTTSLLKTFAAHPEIDMAAQEQCAIAAPVLADAFVYQKLDATLHAMPSAIDGHSATKRAFKCPNAMFTYKSIGRLEKHSPDAKLVVGIRHPVQMMQSFYNYRVTEIYERGLAGTVDIPDFIELVSGGYEPWKQVSMSSVRFELFLQQLGKTVVTPEDFAELSKHTELGYELAIKPSNFAVFLYTIDQLEDTDETRSARFLADLQTYLGLSAPIPPIGHENKNHAVGDAAYPESILICDAQYAAIRRQLVQNGIQTANWLRDHFLHSPDVHVANPEHFVATLESWGTDPCDDEVKEAAMDEDNDDDGTDAVTEFDSEFDAMDVESASEHIY